MIKVKYPSGSNASLPNPTRPKPTSWVWTWTVPKSAGAGTATLTVTCTYGGFARGGPNTFKIVDPTPPPPWSISVDLPGTHPSGSTEPIRATITINGLLPENPAYAEQRFRCGITIFTDGYTVDTVAEIYWDNGDGPFFLNFAIGAIDPEFVGAATWSVDCRNMYIDPPDVREDSGTIEIT
jgi:hypothetical protein